MAEGSSGDDGMDGMAEARKGRQETTERKSPAGDLGAERPGKSNRLNRGWVQEVEPLPPFNQDFVFNIYI